MGKKSSGQQQETEADRAVAQVAKAKVADFNARWAPQQRKLAMQVDASGNANSLERRTAKGRLATDADVAFQGAGSKALAATAATGNVGSSGQKLGITSMADDQSTSVGLGESQADMNVDANRLSGLSSVVAMGQGREGRAINGLEEQAAMSRQVAGADAEASLQRDAGTAALLSRGVGLAAGMYPRGGSPGNTINPSPGGSPGNYGLNGGYILPTP